jgi:wobble nucleotide-excising tRNase
MKIKMTAIELILHLADGSTTPNTLQHISKIAKATIDEMKDREEMQPFIDMTNESYLRGVHDGRVAAQRQWVGLTDEERNKLWRDVIKWGDPSHDDVDLVKAIEAKLKEKNT